MRNLKLLYNTTHDTKIVDPKYIVLDPSGINKNTIFICTENQLLSYNLDTESVTVLTEAYNVVSCEYLSLENEICIATGIGEVLLVNPDTKNCNEVTFCEGGIEKMVWSPDQEVVAFVTKARNVVVMTCTFDPISEVRLDEDLFGENAFITVGWGKKETQFHGSEGKTAAKQTTNFSVPSNVNELPLEIDITWRADGGFFAVTFVGPHGRMFKVFDKEGALKYTSEKLNDLWPAIAWRPSGTWIAIPHKFPNKSTIALFEKNGLRHREIVLPFQFDNEPVVSLKWSADSDILTVETVLEGKSNLYLYTIANYHWYLKQTLCFDGPLSSYVWDNRIGEEKTMHAILPDGTLAKYSWTYSIDRFHTDSMTVIVAVIDGNRLLITNFQKGIIPPPMSSSQLECGFNINACGFRPHTMAFDQSAPWLKSASEDFQIFVYSARDELATYQFTSDNNPSEQFKLISKTSLEPTAVPLSHHNFLWTENYTFYRVDSIGHRSKLCAFTAANYVELSVTEIDVTICSIESGSKFDIFAHTIDGKISLICYSDNGKVQTITKSDCNPGQKCHKIEYIKRDYLSGLVSLDKHQCLRLKSKVISSEVTSFHISNNYLVFTQLAVMKFLRLVDEKIVNERKIERGAKIVAIMPHGSMTILQLPRGNLEVIHPRILCLELVGKLLDGGKYILAMDLVRKQRINLNIICDHNVEKFLSFCDTFLIEINFQWLNLFLTDMQNEDFTLTMYSSNYPDTLRKYPEGFRIDKKVAFICERLCSKMEAVDFHKYLFPILTANVKMGNIEKALEIIWQEKKNERVSSNAADERPKADDALKYLLYLVDVNQLYDMALGMYDFDLVLMVAKKSQKDPREFLPFLNELKDLEENYRKFKIDLHLKRYDKALLNISRCGDGKFEEALDLVKSHNLYRNALQAYKSDCKCYKKIAHTYGDYLRENGKFESASLMYERADDLTQAVACARKVLNWQRCLLLTKRKGVYPQDVAMSLVPSLMEHGQYEDAFALLRLYGNSFSEGIACLLKGNLYLQAIFEARMENAEMLKSVIVPHLLSYKQSLESNLNADRELFLKYKSRLLAVRETKSKEMHNDGLDESGVIDESDLISDTTSMHSSRYTASSRGTGKTFRSSKNRRKHERKLLSLKEGNPFEDIALINVLHNHVMKVYGLQKHIRDTCKALLETVEDAHARAIQTQYRALLLLIQDSLDEIWIPDIMTTVQYITGPNIDYAALQNEQRYAMINPIKRFKPQLTLLDWEYELLR